MKLRNLPFRRYRCPVSPLNLFWTLLVLCWAMLPAAPKASTTENRPNFLVIVADDLGYTDIGAFGGEIETRNLDRMAAKGVKLTNFYAAPTCSPTRAMLLSGVDSHRAGLGNMAETIRPNQVGKKGYEGYLNFDVVSLAEVLKDSNYRTYMAGKWHLGMEDNQGPAARGFARSFALLQGGGSHFDETGLFAGSPRSFYREDGKPVSLPGDFYSSDYYASKLIAYFSEDRDSEKPFLAYLAFTAPHWPLHAPDDLIAKYEARYTSGYQEVLESRMQRATALGVVPGPPEAEVTFPGKTDWSELNQEERLIEARKMAVYAAMVDRMDKNVGDVLKYLQDHDQLQNTYIIFMSDNGAEGHDLGRSPWLQGWLEQFDNSYDNIGRRNSYTWYGPNWAHVATAPYRLYKGFPSEGGIRVPGIVLGPGIPAGEQTNNATLSVLDIMPTILDLAEIQHPSSYQGRNVLPLHGQSFAGLLTGKIVAETPNRELGWELFGNRGLRHGEWKLMAIAPPYGTGEWQLFNLETDPGETLDLGNEHPEKLRELVVLWEKYAKANNVILPDNDGSY